MISLKSAASPFTQLVRPAALLKAKSRYHPWDRPHRVRRRPITVLVPSLRSEGASTGVSPGINMTGYFVNMYERLQCLECVCVGRATSTPLHKPHLSNSRALLLLEEKKNVAEII